jgi:hypothetical protein
MAIHWIIHLCPDNGPVRYDGMGEAWHQRGGQTALQLLFISSHPSPFIFTGRHHRRLCGFRVGTFTMCGSSQLTNWTCSLTAFNKKLVDAYLDIPWVETKCGYACSDQYVTLFLNLSAGFSSGSMSLSLTTLHFHRNVQCLVGQGGLSKFFYNRFVLFRSEARRLR